MKRDQRGKMVTLEMSGKAEELRWRMVTAALGLTRSHKTKRGRPRDMTKGQSSEVEELMLHKETVALKMI